jgi:hypothetical protein
MQNSITNTAENTPKCICFAYFKDGIFKGWHSDTFGTVTRTEPKIYRTNSQGFNIVKNGLPRKLKQAQSLFHLWKKVEFTHAFAQN